VSLIKVVMRDERKERKITGPGISFVRIRDMGCMNGWMDIQKGSQTPC